MSSEQRFEEALEWMSTSLDGDRVAHAHIVVGAPRGDAGRFAESTLGLLFAESSVPDPTKHPDVLWVEPTKKSNIISVDQVRDVRRRMSQTAFAGGWKACVVVHADRLGEEASNALLKTLEEPPGRSMFLLLTGQPEALLPTIVSRCQRIVLSGERESLPGEWREALVGILATEGSGVIGAHSRGTRLAQLLKDIKASVESEISADAREGDTKEVIDARVGSRYRELRSALLRDMVLWYRDIMISTHGGSENDLHFREYASQTKEAAGRVNRNEALQMVNAIETLKDQLEGNLSEASVLNLAFSRLSLDKA